MRCWRSCARFLGIAPFAGITPREDSWGQGPIPRRTGTWRALPRDIIIHQLSGLPIAHWRTLRGEVA